MGTTITVIVVARDGQHGEALVDSAHQLIDSLENKWSRFLSRSEVSRLNSRHRLVGLSAETVQLVQRAVTAWEVTGGLFDPTVLPALIASGYDRTFAEIEAVSHPEEPPGPSPGCGGVVVDPRTGMVVLPDHVALDPGGLGKGYAADLVTASLLASGALGVCINLGGDLKVAGEAPEDRGWVCSLEDPLAVGREIARIRLDEGGVASTSPARRFWGTPSGSRHHLIDPRSGRSACSGLAGVSVISGEAWWAEVLATASFVAGLARGYALVEAAGASGLFVTDDGTVVLAGEMDRFLV